MGSTQQVIGLIPTLVTIGIVAKVASKFSTGKGKEFNLGRGFSRLNKKDNQRL
jgi:hypothetical protein